MRLRRGDRRREFLRNPTVRALLAADTTTGCPRQAVRNVVAEVVREAGLEGPPFDPAILASLHGLRVEESLELQEDQAGCLLAGPHPTIVINASMSRVRRRFTVAHELVHTLLPAVDETDSRSWTYAIDAQSPVEQLCQVGASEILMPMIAFRDAFGGRIESLELALELRERFDVSLEAATRNLVDLAFGPCAMVVLELMRKPVEVAVLRQGVLPGFEGTHAEVRLRVRYSWTSRPWDDRFLPRYKSVPEGSVAYDALSTDSGALVQFADEDWSGVGGLGLCHVQAVTIGGEGRDRSVLCLITPSE